MAELGHVVLYVRDLERSVNFYVQVVGLNLTGKIVHGQAAILTGGRTHHELLLIGVGDAPGPLMWTAAGALPYRLENGRFVGGAQGCANAHHGGGL